MKYAVEMGSGATIYVPSFIKIGSGIQKLIGERYTDSCNNNPHKVSLIYLMPMILVQLPQFTVQ
jgi:hypothetical protein